MMSDTQREILKMLADKAITVDEAERLLRAVNEGSKRKEGSQSRGGGFPGFTTAFEMLGETLADIGPMVKNTVEDVMTGLFGDETGGFDDEEFEETAPTEGKYQIADGMEMVIVNDWQGEGKKMDVRVLGVSGSDCRIVEEEAKQMRVRQSSSRFVIKWQGGPLNVEVPETVKNLKIRTKHGDIHAQRIECEMNLKTLAGNINAENLIKEMKAKTMSGNIKLALTDEWQGKIQAHTMGGHIALAVPDGVSANMKATTMGGSLKVDESFPQSHREQSFPGRQSVTVQTGGEHTDSQITLKTMGGGIEITRSGDAT